MEQLAVFASLRSVQGAGLPCRLGRRFKAFHAMRLHRRPAPPCVAYAAYPTRPQKGDTRPASAPPSEGLTTEHRHPDRSPGTPRRTVFFSSIFSRGRQHLLHGPPQAGANPHPAPPGQGHGLARDFPFPSVDGKMKLIWWAAPPPLEHFAPKENGRKQKLCSKRSREDGSINDLSTQRRKNCFRKNKFY